MPRMKHLHWLVEFELSFDNTTFRNNSLAREALLKGKDQYG
jgi:hypothetical protein